MNESLKGHQKINGPTFITRRGEIKEFDLFKGDNFCRLVFGPPGMGMSYMINDLIRDVSPNPAFTKKIARKLGYWQAHSISDIIKSGKEMETQP